MRSFLVGAALLLAGLVAATPVEAADGPTRLLVLPLHADRVQQNEAQRLGNLVREVARSQSPFSVESESSTTEIVESLVGMGLECSLNEPSCATRVAKVSGAGRVVIGSVRGGVSERVGFELRLVDAEAGAELRRVIGLVPREIEAQQAATAELAGHLFSSAILPRLAVESQPLGADVFVDGFQQGVTPLASAIAGLAPGEHVVELKKKGELPRTELLHLSLGEHADLRITLEVDPASLRAAPTSAELTLPFWFAGGGAVVALGGAAAVAVGCGPLVAWSGAKSDFEKANADRETAAFPARVSDAQKAMAVASSDWDSFGRTAVITGSALILAGTATAAATWIWGSAVEARAEQAEAASSSPAQ